MSTDNQKIELSQNSPATHYVYVVPEMKPCPTCGGTGKGSDNGSTTGIPLCTQCGGTGKSNEPEEQRMELYQANYCETPPLLRVKLESGGMLPMRAHDGDAGIDFYTPIDFTVPPNSDFLLPLNVRTAFPSGWVLWMAEKSGVSTKKKLDIGACIVDSGYRGIVHCHMFNNSGMEQSFKRGDKVVQGILVKCATSGQPIEVDDLDETARGEGAFGSTDEKHK